MVNALEGFRFWNNSISEQLEREYIRQFEKLSLSQITMRGQQTRRFVGQFGGNVYTYNRAARTRAALTPQLESIRAEIATIVGFNPESLPAITIQYYPTGAGIGWHVDDHRYGLVVGLSLGGSCKMQFRAVKDADAILIRDLPARSVYVLDGSARWNFQHRIPPVKNPRYSVTFRTFSE